MGIDPKSLQIGQIVTVQEMNYGVQINTPQEGEKGLTVVSVDGEHLVLGDSAGGIRMSIPLFLIHKAATASVKSLGAA